MSKTVSENKSIWLAADDEKLERIEAFADAYRAFLDAGKTERECVREGVRLARRAGFEDMDEAIAAGRQLAPGARIYRNWMNKSLMLFIVGEEPLEKGMNILGAHIDCPRLDIKQKPLYESDGLAYLDTHYYGGIKKYQWPTIPLALHGVIVKEDGTRVEVCVGEESSDPVFCITDLLPHLAAEQMRKTADKIIDGEKLDVLVGSIPERGEEKEPVKAAVLRMLKERYGVAQEDLVSAELEIVPAGKTRDVGFDRSMLLGYGHDDRACAYPSLAAVCDFANMPRYALCCVLTDKEEIGSVGATGMESKYFENTVAELCEMTGNHGDICVRRALSRSRMLSSDVSAGFDPAFPDAFEKRNSAYLGGGLCLNKYTGSRGKSGSNDANAEYIAALRRVMDEAGVRVQSAELGRVDVGGGGTIAYLCAQYGMQVIDAGVPVLSMHAPWEIISKADLYEAYKGYCAFLKGMTAER